VGAAEEAGEGQPAETQPGLAEKLAAGLQELMSEERVHGV
jgi:hypothetical protein